MGGGGFIKGTICSRWEAVDLLKGPFAADARQWIY